VHHGQVTDLLQAWQTLLARHSASPNAEAAGAALLARWAEPHRRYHDLSHLRGVLDGVEALAVLADDPDAVRLAAWYHDAVYAGDSDDEENSALLAESELAALDVEPAFLAEVGRLVRMTVRHDPAADDRNGQVLSDADLAVLALPPAEYRANTARVRAEHSHVGEAEFRVGRARIISELLAASAVYRTEPGRRLWEDAARANLTAELASLSE
jgi:predicted metal-dependent HD superfamily phosphohydrolase